MQKKVLISGSDGFTGPYLINELKKRNFIIYGLNSNLLDEESLSNEFNKIKPNYVVHLAGISFTQHRNNKLIYESNLIGTLNLLECVKKSSVNIECFLASSTASMYQFSNENCFSEKSKVHPMNHYAVSKFGMEKLISLYRKSFPIIVTRPFNYTGVGQHKNNLVPKIVNAFKKNKSEISLGNIDIYREFNDVRFVSKCYAYLIDMVKEIDTPINICTGNAVHIKEILKICAQLTCHDININIDEDLVRQDEIKKIIGNPGLLNSYIKDKNEYTITDTLTWMLSK